MNETITHNSGNPGDTDQRPIPITIDRKPYQAPRARMTGAELRTLAVPAIDGRYDLFLTVAGPDDDILVKNEAIIDLKPGMDFYSAPTTINPGGEDAVV